MKQIEIVKSSKTLRDSLKLRFKELNLTYDKVVADAKEKGLSITKSNISALFNQSLPGKNYPSQRQLLWLSIRYSIDIRLIIEIKKYDEEYAIKRLKLFFGEDD